MNLLKKFTAASLLTMLPALANAGTSISCSIMTNPLEIRSIGVNLTENASSEFITIVGNELTPGRFQISRVDYLNDVNLSARVITLEAPLSGAVMRVYSEDFQQYTPGMYLGEAQISVGDVKTAKDETAYCTIIVDEKD